MLDTNTTTINDLGLLITLIMGLAAILLPRKYAFVPFLAIGVTVTLGQIWYVAGLHFSIMRILVLFGFARIILRKEFQGFRINEIDKVLLLWATSNVIFYTLREGNTEAFINRLGFAYNSIGIYFIFRFIIRSEDDIKRIFRTTTFLVLSLAVTMLIEKFSGRNLYHLFGGVPEYTIVRDGRLRCQGPFRHAILAGTFGAVTIPFMTSLWLIGKERAKAAMGAVASTFVVIASASGGPVLSYAAAWIGFSAWKLRKNLKTIRWGLLAIVIVLNIVMKSPVWYLLGRVSEIVGGTGWHRSELINQFLNRWEEWWLAGTSETAHWMPYTLRLYNKADITNHFIAQGVDGGLVTFILFIAIVVYAFRRVGLALKKKSHESSNRKEAFLIWGLGVSLFTHVVSFLGVSYFDQMVIYWNCLLAMISALSTAKTGNKGSIEIL